MEFTSFFTAFLLFSKFFLIGVIGALVFEKILERGFLSRIDFLSSEPHWKKNFKAFLAALVDSLLFLLVLIGTYLLLTFLLGV